MGGKDILKADQLASEGLIFSNSLREENREYFNNLNSSYFAIASAIGLTWTRHAQLAPEFINYAAKYIDGQIPFDGSITKKFCRRFGADGLNDALVNYAKFYGIVRNKMPNFSTCDIKEVAKLQVNLLTILDSLKKSKVVGRIGPWLFTGPFKIILGDQDRFWSNEGVNAIVLPTGIEVDRALFKLKAEGYSFMNGFDSNWLNEKEQLLDSFATYSLAHSFIVNIGKRVNCPAIHINSALYLLGRDEI